MSSRFFLAIIKFTWVSTLLGSAALIGYFWLISLNVFGELPTFEQLENPKSDLASELLTKDGRLLGKYYRQNRTYVDYEDISPNLIKTLIATEDLRFESHSGIDGRATARVLKGVLSGKLDGGGSTISQQLAKNLFGTRRRDISKYVYKPMEWIVAIRLERSYTKKEIITMYFNTVNFGRVKGNEILGVNEAARAYFNKKPTEIAFEEAAILIGMLRAPSFYNPIRNPNNAKKVRDISLHQLLVAGFISKEEEKEKRANPIILSLQGSDYNSGMATYFRGQIKNEIDQILDNQERDLFSEGYKIYTTINYEAQVEAEKVVNSYMAKLQRTFRKVWGRSKPWDEQYIIRSVKKNSEFREFVKQLGSSKKALYAAKNLKRETRIFDVVSGKAVDTSMTLYNEVIHNKWILRVGFFSVFPHSGEIQAWVGGLNKQFFQYDNVRQSKHQPGSTFKPVLYSAAMSNGYQPCDTLLDAPKTILVDGKVWKPRRKEATGTYVTLKTAMAKSWNPAAAYVMDQLGPKKVIEHANRLGIDSSLLHENYTLALGTSSLSLWDMIGAYGTFVNQGRYMKPHYIDRIEDKNGKVIYTSDVRPRIAMDPVEAFKMVMMLREGVNSGTSRRLKTFNIWQNSNQVGGKTGTTQNSADGLYFGITDDIVCGVWVGGEDKNIHFPPTSTWGQGARMAMPMFAEFLENCYQNKLSNIVPRPFKKPVNISDDDLYRNILCTEPPLFRDSYPYE